MSRLARVLTLSVLFLPAVASAVELPGEVVEVEAIQTEAAPDHHVAWEAHLRSERARRLADLQAYASAGRFPQKDGEPGWHHQFLDADGVPCAVASLLWTSGHDALVRQTARTHNDVVLSELDEGPLVDWVLTSGLTMEEVAVIQVPGFQDRIPVEITQVSTAERLTRAERREVRRVQDHLLAVHSLLSVDTEASIAKALDRLGDRVNAPPPLQVVTIAHGAVRSRRGR